MLKFATDEIDFDDGNMFIIFDGMFYTSVA